MKLYLFVISLLVGVAVSAQSQKDTVQRLEPAQLLADWDTLYTQLQNNHPALYAQRPKKEADAAFKRARKGLNRPMTRRELDLIARKFIAGFQDGHIYVETSFNSKDVVDYVKQGGKFFPLGVSIIEGKLYCTDLSFTLAPIPLGAEIISINGRSAKELIRTFTSLQPADDMRYNYITTQRLFGFSIWRLYGWGQETQVGYIYDGKRQTVLVEGIQLANYQKLVFGKGPVRQLLLYPEFQLAVLQINSYNNLSASRSFIDSSFRVIKEIGIRHVALDLRKNGGGNSQIGDMVLAYITQKPYTSISSKTWLNGPIMQAVSANNWRYSSIESARQNWELIADKRYYKAFSPHFPDSLTHPELFVDVKFYLLTSGLTYSSAHMTALSVKCGQLGTIIGQPTGERLDHTGEIAEFILPHSQLSIWVPTAIYTSGCGNGKQVGVQPDYYIPQRVEDVAVGRDAELDFLKELIKKENKAIANH